MPIKYPPSHFTPKTETITMDKDLLGKIIQYESEGFVTDNEYIVFFQELIDTGLAWQLQGRYGRTARTLIEAGLCTERNS